MTEREKIAGRIRALRAKTVANGCTEEEAMAAAAKVAEMLAQYNMTVDEAEMRASPFSRHQADHEDHVGERLWRIADALTTFTGATYWQSARGIWPIQINFFGFEHEVEIAAYLLEICASAMRGEQSRILRGSNRAHTPRQRAALFPFLDGMADRLRTRILELVPPKPTGKGLVVLKGELVRQAMELDGIKTKESRARGSRTDYEAYVDGLRAGDRVALNPGIRGPKATLHALR